MDKDDFGKKKSGKEGKPPGKESSGGGLASSRHTRSSDDEVESGGGSLFDKARATAAAASAQAAATDPQRASKLSALKSKISGFDDEVRLRDANREFSSIENTIKKLSEEVEKVRKRGYIFRSYLENKATVINEQWRDIRNRAERKIEDESIELRRNLEEINRMLHQVEQNDSDLGGLESIVERLESKIKSATGAVKDMYANLQKDANQMTGQLHEINWICDRVDEASFTFMAGEKVMLAAECEWDDGGDKPEGFLFLSDQRLVFEQKEKVGKKFGMFGGKEVHEVLWETTLGQVEEVKSKDEGMMGGKDMLYLMLGSGAPYGDITVEVKGDADNEEWKKQIERLISGGANDERAIAQDEGMAERLRNAPTECHICGGMLPKIAASENQVQCQYCGSVVRL